MARQDYFQVLIRKNFQKKRIIKVKIKYISGKAGDVHVNGSLWYGSKNFTSKLDGQF